MYARKLPKKMSVTRRIAPVSRKKVAASIGFRSFFGASFSGGMFSDGAGEKGSVGAIADSSFASARIVSRNEAFSFGFSIFLSSDGSVGSGVSFIRERDKNYCIQSGVVEEIFFGVSDFFEAEAF